LPTLEIHKNGIIDHKKSKEKNHIIPSTDTEKTFDKIQHHFVDKISEETRN
jgi:hypothetical protein